MSAFALYNKLPRAPVYSDPELLWKMKSHAIFLAWKTETTFIISYDGVHTCTVGPRTAKSTNVVLIRTEVEVPSDIAMCV